MWIHVGMFLCVCMCMQILLILLHLFAHISDHEFRFDRMTGCGNGCSVSSWSQLHILPNGAYPLSGPFMVQVLTFSHVHCWLSEVLQEINCQTELSFYCRPGRLLLNTRSFPIRSYLY